VLKEWYNCTCKRVSVYYMEMKCLNSGISFLKHLRTLQFDYILKQNLAPIGGGKADLNYIVYVPAYLLLFFFRRLLLHILR
jgi:hypothetical protein